MQNFAHTTTPPHCPHPPTRTYPHQIPGVSNAFGGHIPQQCCPVTDEPASHRSCLQRHTICPTIDLSNLGLAMQSAVSSVDVLASFASFSQSQLGATCRPMLLPPGKATAISS